MIHIHRWYEYKGVFGGIKQCRKCKKAKVSSYDGIYFVSDHEIMVRQQNEYERWVKENNARLEAGLSPSIKIDKPTRTESSMEMNSEGINDEGS